MIVCIVNIFASIGRCRCREKIYNTFYAVNMYPYVNIFLSPHIYRVKIHLAFEFVKFTIKIFK